MSGNNLDELTNQAAEQTLLEVALDVSQRLGVLEQKMNAIPQDRHNEEHEYLKIEIERKKAQRDFWREIHKKVATATIIGAFGLIISALGYALVQWVQNIKG